MSSPIKTSKVVEETVLADPVDPQPPVVAKPSSTPTTEPTVDLSKSSSDPFVDAERMPTSWHITQEGENIVAVNSSTKRYFKGLTKDFNSLLRG